MGVLNTVVRFGVFLVVAAAGIAVAVGGFVVFPSSPLELAGVLVVLLLAPVVVRVAAGIARSVATTYNVAEVGVTGPITRETSTSALSAAPMGASADRLVEQIERADADGSVDALLVRLNTPGGEIVPSEDIKLAIERFDGPAVAYVTDTCASGGYEIASGCDEIWAREGSIVGSIGVIGSRVNLSELADRVGVSYERLAAGEYKDAGAPLKQVEDEEREYLQGIVDDYYDQFVENVAARRDLDAAEIRDTEARVYLGSRAHEIGLVDELGTRREVDDRLSELLDGEPAVEEFAPQRGLSGRLRAGAQQAAYAFGAGLTATIREEGNRFRFR
jgi:protease-4